MADIVKKIGKITKYETIDYVGGAKMLDLDRAAASESDPAIPVSIPETDESQTGEFPAVGSNHPDVRIPPSLSDLVDLARHHDGGDKR
jgi:hypothetical protein